MTVYVTRVQVLAARTLIKRYEERGWPVWRWIADAGR